VHIQLDLLVSALSRDLARRILCRGHGRRFDLCSASLDIVNIAHPAFIILGSYIAYTSTRSMASTRSSSAFWRCRLFTPSARSSIRFYHQSFEKRGQDAAARFAFFFGLLFITEVSLRLYFGVDYRTSRLPISGRRSHFASSICRCACSCRASFRSPCSPACKLS